MAYRKPGPGNVDNSPLRLSETARCMLSMIRPPIAGIPRHRAVARVVVVVVVEDLLLCVSGDATCQVAAVTVSRKGICFDPNKSAWNLGR